MIADDLATQETRESTAGFELECSSIEDPYTEWGLLAKGCHLGPERKVEICAEFEQNKV